MPDLSHPDQALHFHGGTEASNHLNLNWALCSNLEFYWCTLVMGPADPTCGVFSWRGALGNNPIFSPQLCPRHSQFPCSLGRVCWPSVNPGFYQLLQVQQIQLRRQWEFGHQSSGKAKAAKASPSFQLTFTYPAGLVTLCPKGNQEETPHLFPKLSFLDSSALLTPGATFPIPGAVPGGWGRAGSTHPAHRRCWKAGLDLPHLVDVHPLVGGAGGGRLGQRGGVQDALGAGVDRGLGRTHGA